MTVLVRRDRGGRLSGSWTVVQQWTPSAWTPSRWPGPAPPQQLAEAMHAAWVAFVTTGDPGWPAYDLDRRATMGFDITSGVVEDPWAAVRDFWDGVR